MKHSQNARILAYMKQGRSITPLLALRLFGSLRLAARIYDIRYLYGQFVGQRMIQLNGKRVSVYWI